MPVMSLPFGAVRLFTPVITMGELYDKAISFDELYKGLKKSCRGVRWKDSVASFEWNALRNVHKLRSELLDGRYKISAYQRFHIHEPKEREIVATRIRDRTFQRSLCDNVLYAQITKGFIRDNCACQKGKGVDDTLNRMDAHLHRYYREHGSEGWVLKCDIRHYFAETSHEIAKAAIRKRVTDAEAAERACEIVDSFGGEFGIGLGSQVSQLVELAVLDDFDHWVKERLQVKHYIRYMDDFVIVHEDKATLQRWLKEIADKLSELGLTLNGKTCIYPLRQGVALLKWRFLLTESGKVLRKMEHGAIVRERRKLRRMAALSRSEAAMRQSFDSWVANAKRGDTFHVVNNMTEYFEEVLKNGQHCSAGQPANGGDGSNRAADCDDAGEAGGDGGLHCDDDGCGSVGDR